MADPQATAPAPQATASFNAAAALGVYSREGKLEMGWTGIDQDKTIKNNTIDTNLDAIKAGYQGTTAEKNVNSLVNMIKKYPELKEGAAAMLKDEGQNVMGGFAELVTGNGAIDMDTISAKMDSSPAARAAFAKMMKQVGTSKFDMNYAVRFTRDAVDAAKDPTNTAKVDKFGKTAGEANIDISSIKTEAASDMIADFFKNPQAGIAKFVDSIDFLSKDMKESITGMLSGVFDFYKDIGHKWLDGDASSPGLKTAFNELMSQSADSGHKIRENAGIVDPVNTNKLTVASNGPARMGPN